MLTLPRERSFQIARGGYPVKNRPYVFRNRQLLPSLPTVKSFLRMKYSLTRRTSDEPTKTVPRLRSLSINALPFVQGFVMRSRRLL